MKYHKISHTNEKESKGQCTVGKHLNMASIVASKSTVAIVVVKGREKYKVNLKLG